MISKSLTHRIQDSSIFEEPFHHILHQIQKDFLDPVISELQIKQGRRKKENVNK